MLIQDLFIIILYYMYYEYGSQLYDFVVSLGLVRSSLSVRLGGVSLYSFGRVNVCVHIKTIISVYRFTGCNSIVMSTV